MYIYIHVCVFVYVRIYIYIYAHKNICINIYIYIYTYLETSDDALILKNLHFASCATAFANIVLPLPGGPYNNNPRTLYMYIYEIINTSIVHARRNKIFLEE